MNLTVNRSKAYPRSRGLALTALFAALLAIFSVLSIPLPFSPVPITLQVLFVFLIIATLGPYYGALACLTYLFIGAIGVPVFAGGTGGPGIILGPLGGYLVSFPIAALVCGLASNRVSKTRSRDAARIAVAFACALAIIYSIGVAWLAVVAHLTFLHAFILGALFFIPVDAAKAVVAIPIALYLRRSRFFLPVHL